MDKNQLRHNWTFEEVERLFDLPFLDLIFKAQQLHRQFFAANKVEKSTLLSIKTGTCPENCAYCPQSAHYATGVQKERLLDVALIVEKAKQAKEKGAVRFCMGAAWRSPPISATPKLVEIIHAVRALGLETCMTLGMLNDEQTQAFDEAGLDFYNHNLDTSPDYYKEIITTRKYQDRLDTLERIRQSRIQVCCGGIIGMGEERPDRIHFLLQLANLPEHPRSVPINHLKRIKGTPLENTPPLENIEFIRTLACARIMMPNSIVRIACGRDTLSDEAQALCFMAGANSIFYGEKLLTSAGIPSDQDDALLERLGMVCGKF